jgi:hypothetical protein
MQVTLDVQYGSTSITFSSVGYDEMDEVSCGGNPGLLDDSVIELALEYHNGDKARLKKTPTLLQHAARALLRHIAWTIYYWAF